MVSPRLSVPVSQRVSPAAAPRPVSFAMLSALRTSSRGLFSGAGLVARLPTSASTAAVAPASLAAPTDLLRTATKKAGGVVINKSDSPGQRLGVKKYGNEEVTVSNIIVRQRGTTFHPGVNVYMGKDHTIHAACSGTVTFSRTHIPGRKRVRKYRTFISVIPHGQNNDAVIEFTAKKIMALEDAPKRRAENRERSNMSSFFERPGGFGE